MSELEKQLHEIRKSSTDEEAAKKLLALFKEREKKAFIAGAGKEPTNIGTLMKYKDYEDYYNQNY